MISQKLKPLAWFIVLALLILAALAQVLLLLPQRTKAQSAAEVTINFDTEYQAVTYGDIATLTLNINNGSAYDLTNISVTPRDATFSDCFRTAGDLPDLPGGQSTSLNCESPNLFEDTEVIFDVAATLNGSTAVSKIVYLNLGSTEGLTLEISPDVQTIPANTAANLTVTLHNLGSAQAADLTVSSPDLPQCSRAAGSIPDLAGGESTQFQCQTPQLATDDTYTLTASATTNNLAVTAVAQTTINANSQIDIDVDPQYLITAENAPVTYTITVTNNLVSNMLTNVAVNTTPDPARRPAGAVTGCARPLADMAPGEVITYICQGTAVAGQPTQSFMLSGFTSGEQEDADASYHVAQDDTYAGPAYTYLPVALNNYQRPFTLPDLTISKLAVSQISNNSYSINITVKNQSTLPVAVGNNFFVNAYYTSNLNSPIFICSVQGQWVGVGQSYACSGQITLTSGSHIIRAWADPYGTVTEEYEMNNTRDIEVTHD